MHEHIDESRRLIDNVDRSTAVYAHKDYCYGAQVFSETHGWCYRCIFVSKELAFSNLVYIKDNARVRVVRHSKYYPFPGIETIEKK